MVTLIRRKRMFSKIKSIFFNKNFLCFCIIGAIAYLIHQSIYLIYTKGFKFYDDKYHLISTGIAFIIASIFTYIANAKFTYKHEVDSTSAIKSCIVFIVKFVITEGLTLVIMAIMNNFFNTEGIFYKLVDILLPLILTCITLILQFFAFNVIFKKNDNSITKNE